MKNGIGFFIFIAFFLFTFSPVMAESKPTPDNGTVNASGNDEADSAANGVVSSSDMPSYPVEVKAPSAILTDTERGQILYSENPKEKLHISAACKLMTILIAVESGKLSSNVTVSTDCLDTGGWILNLEAGGKYTLEDLLYGIMLTPANDAAAAVAEFIGGDTDKFVEMMNSTANKLNMADTHFENPTGLYDENQYTTAYDLSLLMQYALANPVFNDLFSTKARPWYYGSNGISLLTSQNKLFWSYEGMDGGKTGYNEKDKQSAITTATKGDMRLICIVLDSPEDSLFTDSGALLDFGFCAYMRSILVHSGEILKTVTVDGSEVSLVSQGDVYYIHPLGDSYIKNFSVESIAEPPVKKTKKAGAATYTLNDGTVINIDLFPQKDIIPPEDFLTSAKDMMLANQNILYLVAFLLLLEIIFMFAYMIRLIKKVFKRIFKS